MKNYIIIKNIIISAIVYSLIFSVFSILVNPSGIIFFSFTESYPITQIISIFLFAFSISGLPLIIAALMGVNMLGHRIEKLIFLIVPAITAFLAYVFGFAMLILLFRLGYLQGLEHGEPGLIFPLAFVAVAIAGINIIAGLIVSKIIYNKYKNLQEKQRQ